MRPDVEDLLRRLALNDEGAVETALGHLLGDVEASGLDAKAQALARLAALVSLESPSASYEWGVTIALAVGASEEELVGVLVAVAPVVGLARVSSAATEVAHALGHQV